MRNYNSPPGVLTPLFNPGLLDGVCLQKSHESQNGDPMLQLEDVEFFPRVSSLFGGEYLPYQIKLCGLNMSIFTPTLTLA